MSPSSNHPGRRRARVDPVSVTEDDIEFARRAVAARCRPRRGPASILDLSDLRVRLRVARLKLRMDRAAVVAELCGSGIEVTPGMVRAWESGDEPIPEAYAEGILCIVEAGLGS
ncbi:hypothetical protein CMI37_09450 [Candidatus Pacearchaeota archaeon]|nr:hypothetical protein [Candidatus Pacearchaeota archaeon]